MSILSRIRDYLSSAEIKVESEIKPERKIEKKVVTRTIRPLEVESPFMGLTDDYKPGFYKLAVYDNLMEAIPLLSTAVDIHTNLVGIPRFVSESKPVQKLLDNFCDNVDIDGYNKGLMSYHYQTMFQAISKGYAVSEIVLSRSRSDIDRVIIGDSNKFYFIKKNGKLKLGQLIRGRVVPINMDNVLYLSYRNQRGHPQGVSIFYSIPFISQILIDIEMAIKNQVIRFAAPTFQVLVTGTNALGAAADEVADSLMDQLSEVWKLRNTGQNADVGGGLSGEGKIEISVLGQGHTLPSVELPKVTCYEQIVTACRIPHWLLSLYKWASNYKMSEAQNTLLHGVIGYHRAGSEGIYRNMISKLLLVYGYANQKWEIQWPELMLMDLVDRANAKKLSAEAEEKEIQNAMTKLNLGWITEDNVIAQFTKANISKVTKARMVDLIEKRSKLQSAARVMSELNR